MRLTRFIMALGLMLGVGVFGVLAIDRLANQPPLPATDHSFGASEALPGDPALADAPNAILGLARPNPEQFIPIPHHPGGITPFANAASYGQPPYRQPEFGGEVGELCYYRMHNADIEQAFQYYHTQALNRGMKLISRTASSASGPNEIKATWSDGKDRLELTAQSETTGEPVQPPLRPVSTLAWVVKYSYPVAKKQ